MKRPIAMRCNQEQFDSIKYRIPKDRLFSITEFKKETYLVIFEDGSITNGNVSLVYDTEIHETFNADIFLEACGVEVEKVFMIGDLQLFNNGEWIDCSGTARYRFKPQPDYSKEIEALQTKAKENGMSVIIKFEKL